MTSKKNDNNNIENFTREYLRRIDQKLDRINDDIRDVKFRVGQVEGALANHTAQLANHTTQLVYQTGQFDRLFAHRNHQKTTRPGRRLTKPMPAVPTDISVGDLLTVSGSESAEPEYLKWKHAKIRRALRYADGHPNDSAGEVDVWRKHGIHS